MPLRITQTERVVSMGRVDRPGLLGNKRAAIGRRLLFRTAILLGIVAVPALSPVSAQFPFQSSARFELSDTVYVDEPESAARTHLEQVKAYLQSEQWDEAIEVLRAVGEKYGGKLVKRPVEDEPSSRSPALVHYISVREYCQWQIAALPAEGLELYRALVDTQAEQAYRAAIELRDARRLERVVEQFFCSSWGDDALLALGDLRLEAGDAAAARAAWLRIHRPPVLPESSSLPGVRRLTYPDSPLPPSDVAVRLAVASILEQDIERARSELSEFARLYRSSGGLLGGREVRYEEALQALLAASRGWETAPSPDRWETFAGSGARHRRVDFELDVGAVAWRASLQRQAADEPVALDHRSARTFDSQPRRPRWLLSYHPVFTDDLILVNTTVDILAFDRATGKPAWGGESPVIFREPVDAGSGAARLAPIGSPRFTMTVRDGRLYARMGSPVTTYGNEQHRRGRQGYLICLDLRAEGRLLWRQPPAFAPDDDKWAFEGSPICDGEHVYVAVRHSDVRPQAHVACYEAGSGRLKWIRYVCAAESPGGGQKDEATSNLITLDGNQLYINTNLGAVASLDKRDGAIRWLTVYRTPQTGDAGKLAAHFQRDLNPCLADRGKVFVAPNDSEAIFAFDASTGDLLWESPHAPDAMQLLGVGGGNLIAAGDRLYWFNIATGKLIHRWPDGPEPKGFGRGALVGSQVVWPTREELYLLSQQSGQLKKVIQLAARHPGHTGGNLLVSEKYLYIAGSDNLTCYSHYSEARQPPAGDKPSEAP